MSQLGGIREGLGAERVRLQMAEVRTATLGAELETLREPRESPETAAEERVLDQLAEDLDITLAVDPRSGYVVQTVYEDLCP